MITNHPSSFIDYIPTISADFEWFWWLNSMVKRLNHVKSSTNQAFEHRHPAAPRWQSCHPGERHRLSWTLRHVHSWFEREFIGIHFWLEFNTCIYIYIHIYIKYSTLYLYIYRHIILCISNVTYCCLTQSILIPHQGIPIWSTNY